MSYTTRLQVIYIYRERCIDKQEELLKLFSIDYLEGKSSGYDEVASTLIQV